VSPAHHFKTGDSDGNKYVYLSRNGKADGRGDMKDLLGGKGAGLAR